jgi:DNA mismatch endonuclease (patch repair protein)
VFARLRKVINVNGCFWHMHACGRCRIPSSRRDYWIAKIQRNATRDKQTRRKLRESGWQVLVLWECQIKPSRAEQLRRRIVAFLDK